MVRSPHPPLEVTMSMLATVVLALIPSGGQRTARRNAWAGHVRGRGPGPRTA